MSTPRQFVLCPSYEDALVVETAALDWLHANGAVNCNGWAGVSVRDDGEFGVFWGEPVREALGDGLELDTEAVTDGVSNWGEFVPPAPEPEEGFAL